MARTMTENDERMLRETALDFERRVWAELDAERAHAAELERDCDRLHEINAHLGANAIEAAAAQAEWRVLAGLLRESLSLNGGPDPETWNDRVDAALSRVPGGNEALRAMLEWAVDYARDADVDGYDHTPEWIVARLLESGDEATKEGGER